MNLNAKLWIKISSSIALKKKNIKDQGSAPLLACCFEITPFKHLFDVVSLSYQILKPGKPLEFAAVKTDNQGGIALHFRYFLLTEPI
jgi:hypothetical protein